MRPLLQFEPTEISASQEKSQNLAILSKLDKEPAAKKSKTSPNSSDKIKKAVKNEVHDECVAALVFRSDPE